MSRSLARSLAHRRRRRHREEGKGREGKGEGGGGGGRRGAWRAPRSTRLATLFKAKLEAMVSLSDQHTERTQQQQQQRQQAGRKYRAGLDRIGPDGLRPVLVLVLVLLLALGLRL